MRTRRLIFLLCLPFAIGSCNRSEPNIALPPKGTAPATSAAPTPSVPAQPQVIVEDDFQENQSPNEYQNMAVVGVKPAPIDAPGSLWQLASGDGNYEANLTPPSELGTIVTFHNIATIGLSLASHGDFQKPTIMTVSAELAFGGDQATGCDVVGFYSSLPGEHTSSATAHFTGIALLADGGLQLYENGTAVGSPLKYNGKYDPMNWATLTYSVDTKSGTISDISLSGSSSSYTIKSAAFTEAATAFLGVGGQPNGAVSSYFTKIKVTAGIIPAATSTKNASTTSATP